MRFFLRCKVEITLLMMVLKSYSCVLVYIHEIANKMLFVSFVNLLYMIWV